MRRFIVVGLAALSMSLVAGRAVALEADELFAKLSPSVWTVLTHDARARLLASGGAVVVGPGRLITNCHVLEKGSSFSVRRDNVMYTATPGLADPERDLCELLVRNFDAPSVELAPVEALRVGMRVFAIGSPHGLEMTLSDGLISALRRAEDGSLLYVQTSAPISPGSSGGGLFDHEGRLVGITTFLRRDSQNLNFAMPAHLIAEMPDRARRRNDTRQAAADNPDAMPSEARISTGARRSGDWFDYVVIDELTKLRRRVSLRVDRVTDGRVYFNGGTRIEDLSGQVIEATAAYLPELDYLTPPGGWAPDGKVLEGVQSLKFTTAVRDRPADFDLKVFVSPEETVRVLGGEYRAVRIDLQGWHARTSTASFYQSAMFSPYKATLWYSRELRRAVKFNVEVRSATKMLSVSETIEL